MPGPPNNLGAHGHQYHVANGQVYRTEGPGALGQGRPYDGQPVRPLGLSRGGPAGDARGSRPLPPDPQRPHRCDFPGCRSSFTRRTDLERHKGCHYPENGPPCPSCGRRFSRQDSLKVLSLTSAESTLGPSFAEHESLLTQSVMDGSRDTTPVENVRTGAALGTIPGPRALSHSEGKRQEEILGRVGER